MAVVFRAKNKWDNQQFHKRRNRVQYASKHYIYVNQQTYPGNDLIFKKKYPYKQRVDRKKFKRQRARKKVLKQMVFDYDDYLHQNKHENHRRIQIRTAVQYQPRRERGIECLHNDYYAAPTDPLERSAQMNMKQKLNIDGVVVTIQFFEEQHFVMEVEPKSKRKRQRDQRNQASNWRQMLPRDQRQADDQLARAIEASLYDQYEYVQEGTERSSTSSSTDGLSKASMSKLNKRRLYRSVLIPSVTASITAYGHKNVYPRMIRHEPSLKPLLQIADNALSAYQYTLCQTNRVLVGTRNLNALPLNTGRTVRNRGYFPHDDADIYKRMNLNLDKYKSLKTVRRHYKTENAWSKNVTADSRIVEMQSVLLSSVPDLWPLYHIIFQFMGYDTMRLSTVTQTLHLHRWTRYNYGSNRHHGIRYVSDRPLQERRRYAEYDKDVESYIPSNIYYHRKPNDSFYDIGEYPKPIWKKMILTPSRKKKSRDIHPNHTKCPCGCQRKVNFS